MESPHPGSNAQWANSLVTVLTGHRAVLYQESSHLGDNHIIEKGKKEEGDM